MVNPYRSPFDVDEDAFDVRASMGVAGRFVAVGIFFAALSGYLLQEYLQVSSALSMGTPGLVFGVGILFAAGVFIPQCRKPALALVPFVCFAGFVLIGAMYDMARPWVAGFGTKLTGLVMGWGVLMVSSLPGVLVLALGCRLIGRPRSKSRFAFFVFVTAGLAGAAPVITSSWPGPLGFVSLFFVTMFVSQVLMFAMLGWILGDSEFGDS